MITNDFVWAEVQEKLDRLIDRMGVAAYLDWWEGIIVPDLTGEPKVDWKYILDKAQEALEGEPA